MMTSRNRRSGLFGGFVVAAILLLASGCQHSDDPAASNASGPSAQSRAAAKADAIKSIEANPQIPEQAKANITRQLHGGPPVKPGASQPN